MDMFLNCIRSLFLLVEQCLLSFALKTRRPCTEFNIYPSSIFVLIHTDRQVSANITSGDSVQEETNASLAKVQPGKRGLFTNPRWD